MKRPTLQLRKEMLTSCITTFSWCFKQLRARHLTACTRYMLHSVCTCDFKQMNICCNIYFPQWGIFCPHTHYERFLQDHFLFQLLVETFYIPFAFLGTRYKKFTHQHLHFTFMVGLKLCKYSLATRLHRMKCSKKEKKTNLNSRYKQKRLYWTVFNVKEYDV